MTKSKEPEEKERASRSIFDPNYVPPPEPPRKHRGMWWKVAVVLALLLTVSVVILKKHHREPATALSASQETQAGMGATPDPTFSPEDVLATVDGKEITLRELEEILQTVPAEYRGQFQRQKHEFLEQIIVREMLLQATNHLGIADTKAYKSALRANADATPIQREDLLISILLQEHVFQQVEISDDDLRAFYEEVKADIPGQPAFESVKDLLLPSLRQQKAYEAMEGYIAELGAKAVVTRNEQWIAVQRKVAAQNPLDSVLGKGMPVLADFGRGTCIPCKMMQPILDKLAVDLSGQVHVLILDTSDYPSLSRKHGVRLIPTQIFFDGSGKEQYRHEGFMSEDDIRRKLRSLGMVSD